jgi:hypothetical protein
MMDRVLKLAERNGLYYTLVERLKVIGYDEQKIHPDRWAEELDRVEVVRKTISLINHTSNIRGIPCIIIKNCSTVPHVPRDIDIFVQAKNRTAVLEALVEKGMKCEYSSQAETSLAGDYQKTDIYTRICYFGVDFLDAEFLHKSITMRKAFGIEYSSLCDEADLLLSVVHSLFGHRRISMLDYWHIRHLMATADMTKCQQYAGLKGWQSLFETAISAFNNLTRESETPGTSVRYPYLFDRSLILKCIDGIEGLRMSKRQRRLLTISLIQDGVVQSLENSPVSDLVKSSASLRRLANTVTTIARLERGDVKSVDEEPDNPD